MPSSLTYPYSTARSFSNFSLKKFISWSNVIRHEKSYVLVEEAQEVTLTNEQCRIEIKSDCKYYIIHYHL